MLYSHLVHLTMKFACVVFSFVLQARRDWELIRLLKVTQARYTRGFRDLGFCDSNLSLNTFLWAFETRTSFAFYLR